jgi:pectinesterase
VTERTKGQALGIAFLLCFGLQQSCTDNEPSRVVEAPEAADAGADGDGSGATSSGGKGGSGVTAGTSGNGAGGGRAGEGGSVDGRAGEGGGSTTDPCLPACDDPAGCELTPVQELELDFCRFYNLHCPTQPADVMMERGQGEPIPAGPAAPSTATRPQLSQAEADELYTIEHALRAGGVFTVSYSNENDTARERSASGEGGAGGAGEGGAAGSAAAGEGGGPPATPLGERTVSYASEDDWDPRGAIEDVTKIVPGLVVDPDGDPEQEGIYTTIQAAISDAVLVAGCPRVFIKVMPGTYREKVTVPAKTSTPPITLYGVDRDPSKIVIVAGHSAAGAEGDGTPLSIHQSATFTNSLPQPFHARNLTFANDYVMNTYPGAPEQQTAVALLTQADKAVFDNVRILGHRHALYVKATGTNEASRAYFRNCYIEGDEDIILGRGTAVIDQCRIHSLGDQRSGGAITAPSTRVDNPHGILIINSELSADARVSNVYLGRQWYEGEAEEAVGKAIIRNSILGAHIRSVDVWAPVLRETPRTPTPTDPIVLYTSDDFYAPMTGLVPPEVYLAEFGNSGPGAPQQVR